MWVWRKMENLKWVDRIRNEDGLKKAKEERLIMRKIRKRKGNCHATREERIITVVLEGSVMRKRGRKRITLLNEK